MIEIENLDGVELALTINRGFTDEEFDLFLKMLESKDIVFGGSYNNNLLIGILDINGTDEDLESVEVLINNFVKTLK